MSNYYFPRCGKAIIDNGGTTGAHWCTPMKRFLRIIPPKYRGTYDYYFGEQGEWYYFGNTKFTQNYVDSIMDISNIRYSIRKWLEDLKYLICVTEGKENKFYIEQKEIALNLYKEVEFL